jgi:hypothetical protein
LKVTGKVGRIVLGDPTHFSLVDLSDCFIDKVYIKSDKDLKFLARPETEVIFKCPSNSITPCDIPRNHMSKNVDMRSYNLCQEPTYIPDFKFIDSRRGYKAIPHAEVKTITLTRDQYMRWISLIRRVGVDIEIERGGRLYFPGTGRVIKLTVV